MSTITFDTDTGRPDRPLTPKELKRLMLFCTDESLRLCFGDENSICIPIRDANWPPHESAEESGPPEAPE